VTHDARLSVTWDGLTAAALARRCEVPHVEVLAETDSTLDVAHALAEGHAPSGTVIVADYQRAGRGRLGRTWISPPGCGVWCTVIERPDAAALDVLSIRVGLRVADALDRFADERVGLKWPNDLVLRSGKLGGVLTEARWSGSSLAWVAIGVGVNVVAPPDIGAAGLHQSVRRDDILQAIVRAVRSAASAPGTLSQTELDRYHARDVLMNRRVLSPATGIVTGISASGALIIEGARGTEQYRAATIRLAEET
jgi:BirA family biotin operon repressor/biotin-[acetyl-CoA-carboxylase] ligase